jgi:hypothetical protein
VVAPDAQQPVLDLAPVAAVDDDDEIEDARGGDGARVLVALGEQVASCPARTRPPRR